jgi:hypothetical protein
MPAGPFRAHKTARLPAEGAFPFAVFSKKGACFPFVPFFVSKGANPAQIVGHYMPTFTPALEVPVLDKRLVSRSYLETASGQ